MDPNYFLKKGARLRRRQLAMQDEISRLHHRGADRDDPTLELIQAEERKAREALDRLKRAFLSNG